MSASVSRESRLLKVILLGDGGVGKSSLMTRFIHNRFDSHCYHTIGVEFLNKDIVVDGVLYTLQIWDTAGQERFRALRTPFYRGSDICLLTFSVDDSASFRNLEMWQKEFLYYGDVPDQQPFPFLVLGNKCDMAVSAREVSSQEALQWCAQGGARNLATNSGPPRAAHSSAGPSPDTAQQSLHVIPYVETSAKDAINVEEGFRKAVQVWQQWDLLQHRAALKHEEWGPSSIRVEASSRNQKQSSSPRRGPSSGCCS